jgi:hypothetical protein
MHANVIHVRSSETGLWSVQREDRDVPLSEHTTETEAERAAIERAAALDDASVVIHDRYSRVRVLHVG